MIAKPRFISDSEHQSAQQAVKEGKSEDGLLRFLNDVMNGRQCKAEDALVVAYAITNASLEPRARKALGLPSKGRGKGSKTDLRGKTNLIIPIVLLYKNRAISENQALFEIRKILGDDASESIDARTIKEILVKACQDFGGLYDFLSEGEISKFLAIFKDVKPTK